MLGTWLQELAAKVVCLDVFQRNLTQPKKVRVILPRFCETRRQAAPERRPRVAG